MASQFIQYEDCDMALNSVQGELLEALLQPDEDFYPWNPAELEAEAYFAELERGFFLSDWQDEEEINSASQALFNQLNECWAPKVSSVTDRLKLSLSERFGALIPQAWLEAIANQAQQIVQSHLSFADQLVLCVEPVLPNWAQEDLLVFARPWAYAMRGTSESLQETSVADRPVEWSQLSQIEQVRLTLAVAHSALVELQDSNNESGGL
ncbi:MAG TPA: hypothetical protein V6D48_22465 [Oculatellaceae cyanobacterium]